MERSLSRHRSERYRNSDRRGEMPSIDSAQEMSLQESLAALSAHLREAEIHLWESQRVVRWLYRTRRYTHPLIWLLYKVVVATKDLAPSKCDQIHQSTWGQTSSQQTHSWEHKKRRTILRTLYWRREIGLPTMSLYLSRRLSCRLMRHTQDMQSRFLTFKFTDHILP